MKMLVLKLCLIPQWVGFTVLQFNWCSIRNVQIQCSTQKFFRLVSWLLLLLRLCPHTHMQGWYVMKWSAGVNMSSANVVLEFWRLGQHGLCQCCLGPWTNSGILLHYLGYFPLWRSGPQKLCFGVRPSRRVAALLAAWLWRNRSKENIGILVYVLETNIKFVLTCPFHPLKYSNLYSVLSFLTKKRNTTKWRLFLSKTNSRLYDVYFEV